MTDAVPSRSKWQPWIFLQATELIWCSYTMSNIVGEDEEFQADDEETPTKFPLVSSFLQFPQQLLANRCVQQGRHETPCKGKTASGDRKTASGGWKRTVRSWHLAGERRHLVGKTASGYGWRHLVAGRRSRDHPVASPSWHLPGERRSVEGSRSRWGEG
eukprot:3383449-Amphidinium_carterae.2